MLKRLLITTAVTLIASENALSQDAYHGAHGETISPMIVAKNRLYVQDVYELRNVYANPGGQACIGYSRQKQGKAPTNKPEQATCETYQKMTPYRLAEILDPVAIRTFQQATLRASCEQQEKQVDGRFIKRAKACERFFKSTKQ